MKTIRDRHRDMSTSIYTHRYWVFAVAMVFLGAFVGIGCGNKRVMSNQSNLSVEERKALKEQTALSNEGEKQTKIQISLRSYVDVDQINNAIVMSGMKVVTAHFYIKSTESVFHRDYEPGVSQVLDAQAAVQEYADSLDFVPIISKQVRNAAEDVQVWALVVEAPANILLEWWLSHAHIVRHARILREGAMHDMIRPDAPYPFIE